MRSRPAFTLLEVFVLMMVAALLLALAMTASDRSRRLSRVGEDLSHLRQIAAGTASYGADFADQIWGFSWLPGQMPVTQWPDLNFASSAFDATSKQLTFLVRSRGGREAWETPVPSNAYVYPSYQHVVLADYLDLPLPSRLFVSRAHPRWNWANDPRGYDQGLYTPNYGTGPSSWRIPYQASFQIGLLFHDVSPVSSRASPASYNTYNVPAGNTIRQRLLTEVALPSQKVLTLDRFSWHYKPMWHMHPESRTPALMVDGSASIRAFAEANRGAHPVTGAAISLSYNPPPNWPEPPGLGSYWAGPLWTRKGIQGRDFGGPEVFP
jgi:type II secretory pathway pseudopilin PulG